MSNGLLGSVKALDVGESVSGPYTARTLAWLEEDMVKVSWWKNFSETHRDEKRRRNLQRSVQNSILHCSSERHEQLQTLPIQGPTS